MFVIELSNYDDYPLIYYILGKFFFYFNNIIIFYGIYRTNDFYFIFQFYKSKFMKIEQPQTDYQKEIDSILDKINSKGIQSLSETEKEILKRLSNKI